MNSGMILTVPTDSRDPLDEPWTSGEIRGAILNPTRLVDLLLADWRRLSISIDSRKNLGGVLLLMVIASTVVSLPYGAVLDPARPWRVAALYLGTVLICFPSLHVFSGYLGRKVGAEQNLAVALVVSSVASLFSFGFFPVIWFLRATLPSDGEVTPAHISSFLLMFSLLAGVTHMLRCMFGTRLGRWELRQIGLMGGWVILVLFIAWRMAIWTGLT